MNKTTKIIFFFLLAFIIVFIISLGYKSFYNEIFLSQECWAKINEKKIEVNGLVKNKYIDSNNHDSKAILVIQKDDINIVHFTGVEDYELWEKIKVTDSIKKYKNSLFFYIKDGIKWDTILVKYNCKK